MPYFGVEKREVIMNQILSYIVFGIMAVMGGGSSLIMVISLPVVILWKFYRKIRYGYKITD